jgi:hypothetical protein
MLGRKFDSHLYIGRDLVERKQRTADLENGREDILAVMYVKMVVLILNVVILEKQCRKS